MGCTRKPSTISRAAPACPHVSLLQPRPSQTLHGSSVPPTTPRQSLSSWADMSAPDHAQRRWAASPGLATQTARGGPCRPAKATQRRPACHRGRAGACRETASGDGPGSGSGTESGSGRARASASGSGSAAARASAQTSASRRTAGQTAHARALMWVVGRTVARARCTKGRATRCVSRAVPAHLEVLLHGVLDLPLARVHPEAVQLLPRGLGVVSPVAGRTRVRSGGVKAGPHSASARPQAGRLAGARAERAARHLPRELLYLRAWSLQASCHFKLVAVP